MLSRLKQKDFVHKIVTGDEKWALYNNTKRKKSWVRPSDPSTSTAKSNIHLKKVLCISWDFKDIIYYTLKLGRSVNSERA